MENNDSEIHNQTEQIEQITSENIKLKRPRGRPRIEKPPKEVKKRGRRRTKPLPDPDAPKEVKKRGRRRIRPIPDPDVPREIKNRGRPRTKPLPDPDVPREIKNRGRRRIRPIPDPDVPREIKNRGRPRTTPIPDPDAPKEVKKRGRPKTKPIPDPDAPKCRRGAPTKDNSEKKTLDIVQYRKNYYQMLKKNGSSSKADLETLLKSFVDGVLKDITQARLNTPLISN
jgi:hypothetical protein